jgi:hypothetical protein
LKIKILLMVVVLAGLLFSLPALAATTPESCGVVPIQQLTYTTSTQIDKFDQSLGTLQSVTVTAQACGYLSDWLESNDQSEIDYNIIARGQVTPSIPGVADTPLQIGTDAAGIDFHAVPDTNAYDRTGTDYTKFDIGTAASPECSGLATYPIPSASWGQYQAVGGGKVSVLVKTHSSLLVDGSNNYESGGQTFMGVTVCVVYEYQPFVCIRGSKVDCADAGLPGWTINLEDANGAVIKTTTTGADGSYQFCDLVPGSYTVCEVMKAGWKNIGDICQPVTLGDVDAEGVDFRNTVPFCISGHKLNNADDSPLAGWTINLKDAKGAVIATKTTGADGSYQFCGQFPGSYTVCEVMQAGWKSVGDTCKPVTVDCGDVTGVDFRNEKVVTPPGCSNRCPWHPVSELYQATCGVPLVIDAAHGILANDPKGSTVINPESITIAPKYGTLSVESDGSFEYDPAAKITSGTYVIFTYGANNGNCDSSSPGTTKIQVYCKR